MPRLVTKVRPERVDFPFAALPAVSAETKAALERDVFRANDRYLNEFLEKYAFCPYSRDARRKGEVHRYMHYCECLDPRPLVELMHRIAGDSTHVVAQVMLPCIDVTAPDFARFVHQLTDFAHAELGGRDVLAVAPLHPALNFSQTTPEALIPLFRRTPDPTIQWVRLDALESVYAGRESDTVFVEASSIDAYLEKNPKKAPLYETIAKANAAMTKRLSVDLVVALLEEIANDASVSHRRILGSIS
jgi:hypothetical protein